MDPINPLDAPVRTLAAAELRAMLPRDPGKASMPGPRGSTLLHLALSTVIQAEVSLQGNYCPRPPGASKRPQRFPPCIDSLR